VALSPFAGGGAFCFLGFGCWFWFCRAAVCLCFCGVGLSLFCFWFISVAPVRGGTHFLCRRKESKQRKRAATASFEAGPSLGGGSGAFGVCVLAHSAFVTRQSFFRRRFARRGGCSWPSASGLLAFPWFASGLFALPLCGAALTFFAAAKKVSKESGLQPPALKRVPRLEGVVVHLESVLSRIFRL
jgi:hypothetical protein